MSHFSPRESALQGDRWLHCVFVRNLSCRNHRPSLIRAPGCGPRPLLRRAWNAWQSWRTRTGPQPGPRGRCVQKFDTTRGRTGTDAYGRAPCSSRAEVDFWSRRSRGIGTASPHSEFPLTQRLRGNICRRTGKLRYRLSLHLSEDLRPPNEMQSV